MYTQASVIFLSKSNKINLDLFVRNSFRNFLLFQNGEARIFSCVKQNCAMKKNGYGEGKGEKRKKK